jgi:hypothetical protein
MMRTTHPAAVKLGDRCPTEWLPRVDTHLEASHAPAGHDQRATLVRMLAALRVAAPFRPTARAGRAGRAAG